MACSRSSFVDCCQPFWSLQPWSQKWISKYQLMLFLKSWKLKINGMKLTTETSFKFQKFHTMFFFVQKFDLFQSEVLVRDLVSRSTKFLFEVFLCVPTLPEVRVWPLQLFNSKLVILNETGPFQLKFSTGWAPQILKCSAQKLQKVRNHPWSKSLKNEVCQLRRPVFYQKIEVEVHHICQEKLASGVKFQKQIMQSVRSPWVHGSEVTKQTKWGGCNHWSEKHGSSASTFLKFNPEVSWSSRKTK